MAWPLCLKLYYLRIKKIDFRKEFILYNLLVSFDKDSWKNSVYDYRSERFLEYTDPLLVKKFKSLKPKSIKSLISYPCLFVYETGQEKPASIGQLTNIQQRVGFIRIHYEIDPSFPEISLIQLQKIQSELDVQSDWEWARTHWAIKDAELLKVLESKNILENIQSRNIRKQNSEIPKDKLKILGTDELARSLQKASDRLQGDPEGAITTARTALETLCKQILDKRKITYEEKDDLMLLYRKVSHILSLSPSHQTEEAFKRIFSGCFSIVEGVGLMRNKLGDAHGKGLDYIKPEVKHARLAVDLSIATVTYILETFEEEELKKDKSSN